MDGLTLRRVAPEDFELLWRWRNDPVTRRMERTREEVSWQSYASWLHAGHVNPRRRLYMADYGRGDDAPAAAGLCELALRQQGVALIGVNLNPDYRGLGLAAPVIRAAIAMARPELRFRLVMAEIRAENIASRRAFARAGFRILSTQGGIVGMMFDPLSCGEDAAEPRAVAWPPGYGR